MGDMALSNPIIDLFHRIIPFDRDPRKYKRNQKSCCTGKPYSRQYRCSSEKKSLLLSVNRIIQCTGKSLSTMGAKCQVCAHYMPTAAISSDPRIGNFLKKSSDPLHGFTSDLYLFFNCLEYSKRMIKLPTI